jgi:hypothetical protein
VKARTIILIAVSVLIAGVAAITYVAHHASQSRILPEHLFQVSHPPTFLTETFALDRAQETLKLDGLDLSAWHPVPDGRTTAPDGRRDEFMARNAVTPNRGVVMFTNRAASVRFVSIELSGRRVVCQTSVGK